MSRFLLAQSGQNFTYAAVGATARVPPAGYVVDYTRTKLGEGESVYRTAKAALENWKQFDLGWIEVCAPMLQIDSGRVVVILAHVFGAWWLNASRVVSVVDEAAKTTEFGFAYGTLPGHAESGEERFLVEWDHDDDRVWYDILAFSRPRHWLARIGYPAARDIQRRFARDSAAAMRRAVNAELTQ